MALTTWLAFLLAATLIAVSPGPGAATSMSVGLRHGYWAALRAILGLQSALVIQLSIVAAGLGALLAASADREALLRQIDEGTAALITPEKMKAVLQSLLQAQQGLSLTGMQSFSEPVRLAEATAATISSAVANGTRASTCCVAGFTTSRHSVVLDSTNWPPISSLTVGALTAVDASMGFVS